MASPKNAFLVLMTPFAEAVEAGKTQIRELIGDRFYLGLEECNGANYLYLALQTR